MVCGTFEARGTKLRPQTYVKWVKHAFEIRFTAGQAGLQQATIVVDGASTSLL